MSSKTGLSINKIKKQIMMIDERNNNMQETITINEQGVESQSTYLYFYKRPLL